MTLSDLVLTDLWAIGQVQAHHAKMHAISAAYHSGMQGDLTDPDVRARMNDDLHRLQHDMAQASANEWLIRRQMSMPPRPRAYAAGATL